MEEANRFAGPEVIPLKVKVQQYFTNNCVPCLNLKAGAAE
jgi:hypothetical protein